MNDQENYENELLQNYTKVEIMACINYMLWHKKKMKGKDIKAFMKEYMDNKRNKNKNKLIGE